ncbi:MAG: hypothetical protein R2792_16715 [Saprospiraceae bacterium]
MGYGLSPTDSTHGGLGVDFNYSPPQFKKVNKNLNFYLTSSTCSDSLGSLLFYTNGIEIRNRNGNPMPNGQGLNSGYFVTPSTMESGYGAANGAVSIPDPSGNNQYYLFHYSMDLNFLPDSVDIFVYRMYYTTIDMNAYNTYGQVLTKNQLLQEGRFTLPALTKHANGRDWWLLFARENEPVYYTYLIHPDGISGPFIQETGPPFDEEEWLGGCNFSLDGSSYIRHDSKGPRIFDFDRCTGTLSNERILEYPDGIITWYAVSSPDSKTWYINYPGEVYSVPLESPDLSASFDSVAVFDGHGCPIDFWYSTFGLPANGPDGKIYYASLGTTRCLGIMHAPDLPGWACDMEQHTLLPRWNYASMNFAPNYRLGALAGSPCDTLGNYNPPGFVNTIYEPKEERKGDDTQYIHIPPRQIPEKKRISLLQHVYVEHLKHEEAYKNKKK